jgi:hypothetical protein
MPNSPNKKKFKNVLLRSKNSWIWRYFEQQELEVEESSGKKEKVAVIVCKYKETSTSQPCGTRYIRKGSSTGNAISHLRSKHNICKVCETFFDILINWSISCIY